MGFSFFCILCTYNKDYRPFHLFFFPLKLYFIAMGSICYGPVVCSSDGDDLTAVKCRCVALAHIEVDRSKMCHCEDGGLAITQTEGLWHRVFLVISFSCCWPLQGTIKHQNVSTGGGGHKTDPAYKDKCG